MIHKPFVHSKQHEHRTPVLTHIVSTWKRSGSVELLAFGCWRGGLYFGSGWKQRRVGSVTHFVVRHGERTVVGLG